MILQQKSTPYIVSSRSLKYENGLKCTPTFAKKYQKLSINAATGRQLGLPQKFPYLRPTQPTLSASLISLTPMDFAAMLCALSLSLSLSRYCQEIEAGTI